MNLADLQSRFAGSLLQGDEDALLESLSGGRFSPASLFDLYRDSVFASLTSVLSDTYPDLKRALGEEDFSTVATAYIRAHPPAGPFLQDYGKEFPTFLAARWGRSSTCQLLD
jgi:hypothetical protein